MKHGQANVQCADSLSFIVRQTSSGLHVRGSLVEPHSAAPDDVDIMRGGAGDRVGHGASNQNARAVDGAVRARQEWVWSWEVRR
jgi:hypothetical protein